MTLVLQIALILGMICALLQIIFYANYWFRLASYKPKEQNNSRPPVSVVIASRNELENLKENLEGWLNQDYPEYELIICNDRSWDKSADFLREAAERNSRLKIVEITEQGLIKQGKKWALFLGIKGAVNPTILLTDADCTIDSPKWISEMMSHYGADKQIVLGYAPHKKSGGLLNLLVRFDTFKTAQNYLSYALAGQTYMGVGRNLSYERELFMSKKGFLSNMNHPSGDDDLFINEAATSKNVAICIHPDAHAPSASADSWSEWFKQKFRHLSTGKFYRGKNKFNLSWPPISFAFFLISSIISGVFIIKHSVLSKNAVAQLIPQIGESTAEKFQFDSLFILFSISFLVLALRYISNGINAYKLKNKEMAWLAPFLDPIHAILRIIWALVANISKRKAW